MSTSTGPKADATAANNGRSDEARRSPASGIKDAASDKPENLPPGTVATHATGAVKPTVPQGERRTGLPDPIPVSEVPPSPLLDIRSPSPGPDYAWVAGSYAWEHDQWRWSPGHWAPRPQPDAVWIPGWYDVRNGLWTPGYWSNDPSLVTTDSSEPSGQNGAAKGE